MTKSEFEKLQDLRFEIIAYQAVIASIEKEPIHGCIFLEKIKGIFRLSSSEGNAKIMLPKSFNLQIKNLLQEHLLNLQDEFNKY